MASQQSSKLAKTSDDGQDLISELPTEIIDEILDGLPLRAACKTSILSRKWRQNWLSLKHLRFDAMLWDEYSKGESFEMKKDSDIISNILLHHNGPVYTFDLYIPHNYQAEDGSSNGPNLSQWLSFLSRNGVRTITINNNSVCYPIPSHIFFCDQLVKLRLEYLLLNSIPCNFEGFAHLRSLELVEIRSKHDVVSNLIASCPRLDMLRLEEWGGSDHHAIDSPNLRRLIVKGEIESLHFNNTQSLVNVSVHKRGQNVLNAETIDAIKILASSKNLQCLHFGGDMCKALAAVGILGSLPSAFNHLVELHLSEVSLDNIDEFSFTVGMITSSPCIKDLQISVVSSSKYDIDHEFNFSGNFKLQHLLKAKIMGIRRLAMELKFVEYVLAISVVLEKLFIKSAKLAAAAELEMLRELMRFPRASTSAQLIM